MIGGREYYLVFSLAAMAQVAQRYGGIQELMDMFQPPEINPEDTEESKAEKAKQASAAQVKVMSELPWLIATLANQGTFIQNLETKAKKVELLTADVVGALLKAGDMRMAALAFKEAVEVGSSMEHEEQEENGTKDLGLQEIESKNVGGAGE